MDRGLAGFDGGHHASPPYAVAGCPLAHARIPRRSSTQTHRPPRRLEFPEGGIPDAQAVQAVPGPRPVDGRVVEDAVDRRRVVSDAQEDPGRPRDGRPDRAVDPEHEARRVLRAQRIVFLREQVKNQHLVRLPRLVAGQDREGLRVPGRGHAQVVRGGVGAIRAVPHRDEQDVVGSSDLRLDLLDPDGPQRRHQDRVGGGGIGDAEDRDGRRSRRGARDRGVGRIHGGQGGGQDPGLDPRQARAELLS